MKPLKASKIQFIEMMHLGMSSRHSVRRLLDKLDELFRDGEFWEGKTKISSEREWQEKLADKLRSVHESEKKAEKENEPSSLSKLSKLLRDFRFLLYRHSTECNLML